MICDMMKWKIYSFALRDHPPETRFPSSLKDMVPPPESRVPPPLRETRVPSPLSTKVRDRPLVIQKNSVTRYLTYKILNQNIYPEINPRMA